MAADRRAGHDVAGRSRRPIDMPVRKQSHMRVAFELDFRSSIEVGVGTAVPTAGVELVSFLFRCGSLSTKAALKLLEAGSIDLVTNRADRDAAI